jgi:hypothetical protein
MYVIAIPSSNESRGFICILPLSVWPRDSAMSGEKLAYAASLGTGNIS